MNNHHDRYVAEGNCPSTMPGNEKVWCNGKKGHLNAHWAQRLNPPSIPYTHPNHASIKWIGKVIQSCCEMDIKEER